MIYSKNDPGIISAECRDTYFKSLSEATMQENSVYWYDQHDKHKRGLLFTDCVDEAHWEHLRNDPTAKILIYYGNEYFNLLDIEDVCRGIQDHQIDPNSIWLITVDKNWVNWATEQFNKRNCIGINITDFNALLLKTKIFPKNNFTTKTFSALSRNYNKWRLKIFLELVERGLLDNFTYSFNNFLPYDIAKRVPHATILDDVESINYTKSKTVLKWVKNMPYTLNSEITNKWTDVSYTTIQDAKIHLLIESHFDPFWNFQRHRSMIPIQSFSPAFPTEKTYKVMSCSRPFIAFSTPYFLKELRELGYKTFHPIIDESYDEIENDSLRLTAIANEVERLCNLPAPALDVIYKQLQHICNYNRGTIMHKQKEVRFLGKFDWLNEYKEIFTGRTISQQQ